MSKTAAAPASDEPRSSVHVRHEDRNQTRVIRDRSFEEDAAANIEDRPVTVGADESENSVIVRNLDLDSGHERRLSPQPSPLRLRRREPAKPADVSGYQS